jgi:hypothetical protein
MYRETVGGGGGGTIEQNLRKLQLMLNVSWKRRQISQEALNARGFHSAGRMSIATPRKEKDMPR